MYLACNIGLAYTSDRMTDLGRMFDRQYTSKLKTIEKSNNSPSIQHLH